MFRSFRNFPRISDKGNVVTQPQVNVFVADGVNDTSKGVWISPTRTDTNEDGTLHIGLMNPFEGAVASIVTGGNPDCTDPGIAVTPPCNAVCNDICDCDAVFAAVCAAQIKNQGFCQFNAYRCVYESDFGSGCGVRCQLFNTNNGLIFSNLSCNGTSTPFTLYQCGGGEPPPDVESQILRAVERFVLEMDLSALSNVQASNINSAILRLPIKTKLDWM